MVGNREAKLIKMSSRFLFIIILLMGGLSSVYAQSADIKLSLETDKKMYQVGDKIIIKFRLDYPGEYRLIEPGMMDSLTSKGLDYLTTDTLENYERDSKIVRHLDIAFAGYDSLDVNIEKFDYRFVKGNDTLIKSTSPFLIKIRPLEIDTTKEISDLKPPERIPWGWFEYLVLFGGLSVVALLGYLIYRRFTKKPMEEKIVPEPVKILTNFEKALEKLNEVEKKEYIQKLKHKEHFSEVSDTVRWYFEVEYGFPSLELTTRETISKLRQKGVPQDIISGVDDFLTRADMVKFAKYIPSDPESGNYIAGVVALMRECDGDISGRTKSV